LLKADGLWSNWRSRLALARILLRIFRKLTPRLLRVLLPGYRPAKIADPAWLQHWAALHIADKAAPARIDTDRLDESRPVSLPA
jgi:hypothetical protein